MAKLNLVFVSVLFALVACAPAVHTPQCVTDPDCGVDLICDRGMCMAQPDGACRTEETRPCGPPAVGLCHPGVQRCSDRKFTTTCDGQVTAVAELCNGLDDDCDGVVDNGVTTTWYRDLDGDGFGSSDPAAETRVACTQPSGFARSNTDCDDSVAAFNPGATEVCDAANADEDCNGTSNDGCGCSNVGMTQACCASRGTQVCEDFASGPALSLCTVSPTPETCNGIDDDCDGQTDEQYRLPSTDGGSVIIGGGVFELDGGCTVGVGACARTAETLCTAGALACNASPGTPVTEVCNGLDDDCDGQTDENDPGLCPASGQSCSAGSCVCPAGQLVCGTSCQALNTACSVGTGACARQGTMLCSNGTATCSATAGTPGTEVCNNLDDDCDGQVDEASPSLCAASGQTCSLGACACPAGQTVCGTSCETLATTCSPGVGACQRTGTLVCVSGGVACSVTAGTPVSEACDGVDNDCDGVVDNGVTITCYPDGDNDTYPTSLTPSQQCPAPGRGAFGNCPTGYVSVLVSTVIDCDPANASLFRIASIRGDLDSDNYCTGVASPQCVGIYAPVGSRFASACAATDDCNDASAAAFNTFSVRTDADNDTFCVGNVVAQCAGGAPLGGTLLATACAATTDCNDASAAAFKLYSVRADADNDGYCVGNVATQCAGNAPLAGTRLATSCAASDDCRDLNSLATTVCSVPVGYTTAYHSMSCGIGLPGTTDTLVQTLSSCPQGFSLLNLRTEKVSGAGSCSVVNANVLRQSCTGFDASNCRIVGDCTAN